MPAGPPAAGLPGPLPRFIAASLLAAAFLAGCTRDDEVEVLRVPKDAAPVVSADPTQARDDVSSFEVDPAERTDRMFAAIVPHGDTAWFFKLTGPDSAVAPRKGEFLSLLKSVTFDGDKPRWTLPEGWSEQPGSESRFATLVVPTEPPAEVSIISLGLPEEDRDNYLLDNVNRWRGQMRLPPMAADDLHAGGDADEETTELPLADGTKATLVSLKGKFSAGGMTPPFAGGMRPPAARGVSPRRESQPPAGDSPVKYELPEGWKALGPEGISVASFDAGGAKVTIISLSAQNELLANVNRWRGQVGLPPIEEQQIGETVESITLGDGEKGDYVVLTSPDDVSPRQALLAVMAKRGDRAWFVKLISDAEAGLREKSRFESFVKSLRFPG